jgi:hypothetical protein
MAGNNKRRVNLSLLLPVAGLVIEIIAILILRSYNVEFNQNLLFFLVLIGGILLYQIIMQIIQIVKVNLAIKKSADLKALVESGQGLEAIKAWKKELLILPKDPYLATLDDVLNTYQTLEMKNGVQKTERLIKKSKEFFALVENNKKPTPDDRKEWQTHSVALRKMVKDLPES